MRDINNAPGSILLVRFIPLPNIASIGIINKNMTTTPPNRFPTNICGSFSIIEVIPTPISGMEVSIPRIKKERAKRDIFIDFDILSTEEIIKSEAYQRTIKEKTYRIIFKNISIINY